eukprot:Blabericola_migrator_1__7824@NODE_3_length_32604_cov_133_371700_g2_i0_p14_GENE_NODE_3_length_32604_cov_133_371700_g2_i0NODE_3_length_32604_cov_133_371700_g2_i0_p14_ORF_typecomplete_len186_score4_53DUF832/PF05734_11/6_8DUF832/PF05734_11/51_NODE_3_length_32604_cov_133_371700_g2_i07991356
MIATELIRMSAKTGAHFEDGGSGRAEHFPILDCDCHECEKYFAGLSTSSQSTLSTTMAMTVKDYVTIRDPPRIPPCLALNASGTSMTCGCSTCRAVLPHMGRWTAVALTSSCCASSVSAPLSRKRRALGQTRGSQLRTIASVLGAMTSDSSSLGDTKSSPQPHRSHRKARSERGHRSLLNFVSRR